MAVSTHTLVAREGMPLIMAAVAIAGMLTLAYGWIALPLWLLVALLAWLYRDPLRQVPSAPLAVISPVEGRVITAEKHPDPYLGRDAYLVSIQMSATSVYSIRGVIEGKIMQQWLDQGTGGKHDVAHAIQVQTDENENIVVVLRPGRIFHRLSCNANIGERIGQGHRCGIIPLGSIVDVYLPLSAKLNVSNGEWVTGGETILAELSKH